MKLEFNFNQSKFTEKQIEVTMPHFDCHKMPGWFELSDSERWHAGYCARKLDDSELVNEWRYGCASLVGFTSLAENEKFDAWLVESLLVALTSQDKQVAFRSLVQAVEYFQKAAKPSWYYETLAVAKQRIEGFLRP